MCKDEILLRNDPAQIFSNDGVLTIVDTASNIDRTMAVINNLRTVVTNGQRNTTAAKVSLNPSLHRDATSAVQTGASHAESLEIDRNSRSSQDVGALQRGVWQERQATTDNDSTAEVTVAQSAVNNDYATPFHAAHGSHQTFAMSGEQAQRPFTSYRAINGHQQGQAVNHGAGIQSLSSTHDSHYHQTHPKQAQVWFSKSSL